MSNGTRPHFHVSYTLHGAMKDVASAHDLTQSQVYELAATLLVSLDENTQVKPTPSDEEVADLLDELIENCTEKREE